MRTLERTREARWRARVGRICVALFVWCWLQPAETQPVNQADAKWLETYPQIDMVALRGYRRAEIEKQFPRAKWTKSTFIKDHYLDIIRDWGPWKEITFDYDKKSSALTIVNFVPKNALSEAQAVAVLTERLNVQLQKSAYESFATLASWEGMKGPIQTVMLYFKLNKPKSSEEIVQLLMNPNARNGVNSGVVEHFTVSYAE